MTATMEAPTVRNILGEAPQGSPRTIGRATVGEYPSLVEGEDGELFSPPILRRGQGFMEAYDYIINPYAGCTFGCSYCFASNLAPEGLEKGWGNWVQVKTSALESLKQVRPGRLNHRTVYASSVTDPYQPVESQAKVWRGLLEHITGNHPMVKLVVQTRSNMVARDLDLYQQLTASGRVQVNMTVGSDNEEVIRSFEPGCQPVKARLKALEKLAENGIQTCVTITPMLPMDDPAGFIQRLADQGTSRFIMQPFHTARNPDGHFMTNTDREALRLLSEWYGTEPGTKTSRRYNLEWLRQSREIREKVDSMTTLVLAPGSTTLEGLGQAAKSFKAAWLGEGKERFMPPF